MSPEHSSPTFRNCLFENGPLIGSDSTWVVPSSTDFSGMKITLSSQIFTFNTVHNIKRYNRTDVTGLNEMEPRPYRDDFQGLTITNVVIGDTIKVVDQYRTMKLNPYEEAKPEGFLYEVLLHLADLLNFHLITVSAPRYGQVRPFNANITGPLTAMDMLQNGFADISTAPFQPTRRHKVLDFTLPILISRRTLMVRKGQTLSKQTWSAYFSAFAEVSWLFYVLIIALSAVVLMKIAAKSQSISTTLALVLTALIQRESTFQAETRSAKVASLSICMFGFLTLSAYSALLTSRMTVPQPPIQTLREAVERGVKILVPNNTLTYHQLHQYEDNVFREIVKHEDRILPSFKHILDVIENTPAGEFAYLGDALASVGRPQLTALALKDTTEAGIGLALAKGSRLREAFDYHLLLMEESGLIRKLRNEWGLDEMSTTSSTNEDNSMAEDDDEDEIIGSLSYGSVSAPFAILVIGIASATFLLILEALAKKTK